MQEERLVLKVAVGPRQQLDNEAAVLEALSCAGVCGVPEYIDKGCLLSGNRALLLRCCNGRPLTALVRTRRCTPTDIARWMKEAATILRAVHRAGYVHGDLKPEHFLLDARGSVTLIDFGCSVRVGERYHSFTQYWASANARCYGPAAVADDFEVLARIRAHLSPAAEGCKARRACSRASPNLLSGNLRGRLDDNTDRNRMRLCQGKVSLSARVWYGQGV